MPDYKSLYAHIGQRLKELRKGKRLTQSRLADIVGLRRTSVTNIEKGRQNLLVHTLCELAKAVGAGIKDFLPKEPVPTKSPKEQLKLPPNLSKKETKWIKTVLKGGGQYVDSKKEN